MRTRDIYYFTNTKSDGWSEGPRKGALESNNQPVKMSIHHRCFLPSSTPCTYHRRRAESILARALIWPFCTFLTPSPSSLPLLEPIPPRSVVLVAASLRRCSGDFWLLAGPEGRSVMVSSLRSLSGFLALCLRTGGEPKISPEGSGCCPRGS